MKRCLHFPNQKKINKITSSLYVFHHFNAWLSDEMVLFFICSYAPAFMVSHSL